MKSAVWETSEPHKVSQIHQFYGKGNIDGSNLDLAAGHASGEGWENFLPFYHWKKTSSSCLAVTFLYKSTQNVQQAAGRAS